MKTRILVAMVAVTMVGLLSACDTQNMAGTSSQVAGAESASPAETCVSRVTLRSGSSGVKVMRETNPGGAGMIFVNTPANGSWTCYTNAKGQVNYIRPDSPARF